MLKDIKRKLIMLIVLALALVATSAVPVMAYSEGTTLNDAKKGEIGIVYLGNVKGNENGPKTIPTTFEQVKTMNAGAKNADLAGGVWIGYYIADIGQANTGVASASLTAKSGGSPLNNLFASAANTSGNGIWNYTVAISYDKRYVKVADYTTDKKFRDGVADLINDLSLYTNGDAEAEPNSNGCKMDSNSGGNVKLDATNDEVPVVAYDADTDGATPPLANPNRGYAKVIMTVEEPLGSDGINNTAVYFLMITKFKLKDGVESSDIPAGTVLFEPSMRYTDATLSTGKNATSTLWEGAWKKGITSDNKKNNLKTLFEYDPSINPQFFPASAPSAPTVSAATISGWPSWVSHFTGGTPDAASTGADGKLVDSVEHGLSLGLGSIKVNLTMSAAPTPLEKSLTDLMDEYNATVKMGSKTYTKDELATATAAASMDGQEIVITIPDESTTDPGALEVKLGKLNISDPVQSIAIKTQPTLSYAAGATISVSNLVIEETLKSGAKHDVNGADALADTDHYTFKINGTTYTAMPAITSAADFDGKTIDITYTGKNTVSTGKISVTNNVKSIDITAQPSKLTYSYGDKYDLAGLKITVTYDDNSTEEVTFDNTTKDKFAFAITSGSGITSGTTEAKVADSGKTITVTYGGKPATTSALTVNPRTIDVSSPVPLGQFTITPAAYTETVSGGVTTRTANADIYLSPLTGTLNSNLITGGSGLLDADKTKVRLTYEVAEADKTLYAGGTAISEAPVHKNVTLRLVNVNPSDGVSSNYSFGTGGTKSGQIDIVVTSDPVTKIEIVSPVGGAAKEITLAGSDKFDTTLGEIEVKITKQSGATETKTLKALLGEDMPAVVTIVDNGVTTNVTGTTDIKGTMDGQSLNITYRGVPGAGETPVTVPLSIKNPPASIALAADSPAEVLSYTNGDTLDFTGLKFEVTYADGSKETYAYPNLPAGASVKIALADDATAADQNGKTATTKGMDGKKLAISYTDANGTASIPTANQPTLTVAQAGSNLTADGASGTSLSDSASDVSGLTRPTFTVTSTSGNGATDKDQDHFKIEVWDAAGTNKIGDWTSTNNPITEFATYTLKVTYTDPDGNFANITTPVEFTYEASQKKSGGGGSSSGTKQVVNINPTEEPPVEEEPDNRLIVDIPDIPDTDADDIYMKGYVRRNGEHTFRPSLGVTRAEVAMLIARLMPDFDESKTYDSNLDFPDVPQDEWYKDAVAYAVNKGLVNGYNNNTFRPDRTISRQEFAAIIARYLDIQPEGIAEYTDTSDTVDVWATGYINQLSKVWLRQGEGTEPFEGQILNGYNDGSFRPRNNITRAEVTKVLNRVFGRIPNEEKMESYLASHEVDLEDVSKDYWAYYEILEASVEHIHGDFH